MKISVLGTGCPKCTKLAELAEEVAEELDLDYQLEKITDISQIVAYGILATPGLVINDQVRLTGRVPSHTEMKDLLS